MRKSPCKGCPFKRDSLPGYLGEASHEPEEFLDTIEDNPIPCHMQVDWDKEDGADKMYTNPCNGALRFLKNTFKLPRNPKYAALRNLIKETDPNIFNKRQEFIDHHK